MKDAGNTGVYVFGVFRPDAGTGLLTAHGEKVKLAPKVFECLLMLVENQGGLVGKSVQKT